MRIHAPGGAAPRATFDDIYDADLRRLSQRISGADVRISDLQEPVWGHLTVGELLGLLNISLPREQVDRASMLKIQIHADGLLSAAARALHSLHQFDLEAFWTRSGHPLAKLWRVLQARHMRPHVRTQVVP